ncbi:MAG: multiheme c-type cytochrome [bacterium]
MLEPSTPSALARLSLGALLLVGALALPGCPERRSTVQPAPRREQPSPRRVEPARPGGRAAVYKYQASTACEDCHPNQTKEWKGSAHQQAHFEPIYDFYFMTASRQSGKKLETFCAKCHTPLGVHAGEIPFGHPLKKPGDTKVSTVATEGVSCDFCHTISGVTKVQNSGYVMTPSVTKQGQLRDAKPQDHKAQYSALFRSAELCGSCHQVVHPTNGIVLEDTYGEWKRSAYAKAGIVCQDCHMTAGLKPQTAATARDIGKPERHPGTAAEEGRKRAHVSQHHFVGPNLFLASGNPSRKRAAEALLRRAGRVTVDSLKRVGRTAVLKLKVSNTGAGHYLPTGVSELRELWLDVEVRNGRGRVIWRSGALGADGNLGKDAVVYRTIVHDAKGKDTTLFWNTVKKVKDRRIPPLGSLTETFRIPLGRARKVTVKVSLHYRPVSPYGLAEAGVPKGRVQVPIFTISSCTGKLTR